MRKIIGGLVVTGSLIVLAVWVGTYVHQRYNVRIRDAVGLCIALELFVILLIMVSWSWILDHRHRDKNRITAI